jgi:uncharacterized protein with FMN-binding domain
VDLTGVSPLVGLTIENFTVGQAALKAASNKVAKHERACFNNQHAFIPVPDEIIQAQSIKRPNPY